MSGGGTTTVREIERKYESDQPLDPGLVGELAVAVGCVPPAEPTAAALTAVYYDTADLRLIGSRLTLRRRRGGSDEGWHLKLPAGGDQRDEVRLPLGRRTPPAALVALSRAAHRGAALEPVVELVTDRREWTLVDAEGFAVATVTDDRVVARPPGDGRDGGTGVSTDAVSWAEIEVELAEHGTPEALDRIEEVLAGAGVHRSASPSKLGRALGDRVPAPPARPVAERGGSAGQVVLAYLAEQVDAIHAADPRIRRDVAESVHQMRVACRRLRSALQSYRALLDRAHTDDVVTELRWLATELGGARDLEVQEERLSAAVAGLSPEVALGPVGAQTTRFFATRRTAAAKVATAALDGPRYVALLDTLDTLLTDPPLTEAAAGPARTVLPALIGKALRRVGKAYRAAHRAAPGDERDEHLHEMRKAAKRLRYATEVAGPALGRKAKRLVKRVKAVQELLGEHQDSVVARGLLRELGATAGTGGGNGFAFGWLLRDEQVRAAQVEDDLGAAWRALRKRAAWL